MITRSGYEQALVTAKGLDREAARPILLGIERDGDPASREEARRLLEELRDRPVTLVDPELEEAHRNWMSCTAPSQSAVLQFLGSVPGPQLNALKPIVVQRLAGWLTDYASRAQRDLLEIDQMSSVHDLSRFLQAHPVLGPELSEQLRDWEVACWSQRYRQVEAQVRDRLAAWDPEGAEQLIERLANYPPDQQVVYFDLLKSIEAVSTARDRVRDTMDASQSIAPSQLPAATMSYGVSGSARHVLECQLCLLDYAATIPEAYRAQLVEGRDRSKAAMEERLKVLAIDCGTLADLEAVSRHYLGVKTAVLAWVDQQAPERRATLQAELVRLLPEQADWLADALTDLEQRATNAIRVAQGPEEVLAATSGWSYRQDDLPDWARERLRRLDAAGTALAMAWSTMQSGSRFTASEELSLMCLRFREEETSSPGYCHLLERLDKAQAQLFGAEPSVESAMRTAEEVLELVPGHREAQSLKAAAERMIRRLEWDHAIRAWDVEGLQGLVARLPDRVDSEGERDAYQALASHFDLWCALADLQVFRSPLGGPNLSGTGPTPARVAMAVERCDRQSAWWSDWTCRKAALLADLPEARPAALDDALKDAEGAVLHQWTNDLDWLTYHALPSRERRTTCGVR